MGGAWVRGEMHTKFLVQLLKRSKNRWGDNIRMDLIEVRWEVANWFHLDQDRDQWQVLVNMVMNPWVP
jgi:hypothetical protein